MIVKNLRTGKIGTCTYIVSDEGEAVIIDPAGSEDKIAEYITQNALKVKYVLLTHGHADHFYAAKALCKLYSVCAAIGEIDSALLYDNEKNAANLLGLFDCEAPDTVLKLTEGDKITFGNTAFTFINLPGHTAGGGGYYTPGCIFSGDTLFRESVGRSDLYSGGSEELLSTIKNKLFTLPEETVVYSGHTGRTTIGWEKENNPFLKG